MFSKTAEKGQALVLIALAAVGLFAFAALAIDGSRVYSDKRHAQNAADTASMAGGLAYIRATEAEKADETTINSIITDAAQKRATSNSYNNDTTSNIVTVKTEAIPPDGECGETGGKDITVTIISYVNTTFARVIGRTQVTNAVTATAQACDYYDTPPFNGNPIVGLGEGNDINKGCPTDSGNGDWLIKGGGVFSNGCAAFHKVLDLEDGDCISTVGSVGDIPEDICTKPGKKIKYPKDVEKMMPPNPCTGAISGGRYAGGGKVAASGQTTFDDDIFCISQMDPLDKKDIFVNNATLYVTDTSFNLQFTGQGGFSGTATQAETYPGSDAYDGYFMIIMMYNEAPNSPCTDYTKGDQVITIRGNSGQTITGAILAPSACLDLRGNSTGNAMNSQIIGYTVSSNGSTVLNVDYNPDDNPMIQIQPSLSTKR